jgi:signal transduction histidine kinase
MELKLLEIGSETEQLSACKLSLLLGVFGADNRITDFLKFARSMLQTDYAILAFKGEPYIWFSSDEGCRPFLSEADERVNVFFEQTDLITPDHPIYAEASTYMQNLGMTHRRMLAVDLCDHADSVGHVYLFDQKDAAFDQKSIVIVREFIQSLMGIIRLRLENADLKELYEQQEALNFSKTKFFQIIAHDLRAPFHGLLGFSEVLAKERDTLDEQGIQDISEYVFDTAQSTYNLLENLLNWAMAEGGRFVYHPINFALSQSTKIVTDVLGSLAVKKNIQLINQVDDQIKVYADINMVTSVIQNLVSNALKFTHNDGSGKVILRADVAENQVHIYIQDSGLGMTKAQIDNIFEPKLTFSSQGTLGEKGTGLGLVLCKRFIDINQGQISVSSKEGEGTLFKVSLPAAGQSHQALE